jgi:oxygen-independent coproporphyrinogen-3 oxidase
MVKDGLVIIEGDKVKVTEIGIPFVRNCCMAFDQDLADKTQQESMFSKTI